MKLLNKNECQESFVSKAFKGIVINYNLPQAQHQMYMACTPPTFSLEGGGRNFETLYAKCLEHSCFSSRLSLKQLASHVSADTLQLIFPGM